MHLLQYQTGSMPVKPVTGRFLTYNRDSQVARAFIAADLVVGDLQLVRPTVVQAALLARVSVGYVGWARKRQAERAAIEAGLIPLVPAQPIVPKINAQALLTAPEIDDVELIDIARHVGAERMLAAAVAVEAAH